MDTISEILNYAWFGTLVGLIGIVLATYFYLDSKLKPRPTYQIYSTKLIGSAGSALPAAVSVYYKGQLVPRLTKTTIVFWNAGNLLLRGEDVVVDSPIHCKLEPNAIFLETNVRKTTKAQNKFSTRIEANEPNVVVVNFDYLDPNDGGVFELLHTSGETNLHLEGTIRGIPTGIRRVRTDARFLRYEGKALVFRRIALIVMAISGVTMTVVGFGFQEFARELSIKYVDTSSIILGIMGLIYCGMTAIAYFSSRRRFPKSLVHSE